MKDEEQKYKLQLKHLKPEVILILKGLQVNVATAKIMLAKNIAVSNTESEKLLKVYERHLDVIDFVLEQTKTIKVSEKKLEKLPWWHSTIKFQVKVALVRAYRYTSPIKITRFIEVYRSGLGTNDELIPLCLACEIQPTYKKVKQISPLIVYKKTLKALELFIEGESKWFNKMPIAKTQPFLLPEEEENT
jgi:hypothetical protein